MKFISIIIPAYNRGHMIGITLESFLAQNYPKNQYEIIVSDNNSKDNTAEVVKRFIGKTAVPVIYHLEQRQGVHFARNAAAHLSKGDILYYTDDDMIADNNLLAGIAKLFLLDKKIASATGKVLPKWKQKLRRQNKPILLTIIFQPYLIISKYNLFIKSSKIIISSLC